MSGAPKSRLVKRVEEGTRLTLDNQRSALEKAMGSKVQQERYGKFLANSDVKSHALVSKADTKGFGVAHINIPLGSDFPKHFHARTCAFVFVLEGRGRAEIDGEVHTIQKGDWLFVKAGSVHEFFAEPGGLQYLAISNPDLLSPDEDGGFDFVFVD